ncbi:MAG: hypothetical protein B6U88_00845 [Candidatus Aenigmarchaeota archaeon ex4484_56]|nr:MAG: hypothetical protein B6U88_00845 [Candidatus Aenigmarchaeota archaeon ex4484_56]
MSVLEITGVYGVGKTTLIHHTIKKYNLENKVFYVRIPDYMKEETNLDNIEDLRKLDKNTRALLRKKAQYHIYNDSRNIVLDEHLVIPLPNELEILDSILFPEKIVAFCVIYAKPNIIYKRIKKDNKKNRKLSLEQISDLQNKEIDTVIYLSKKYGKKLYCIENDYLEKASGELYSIISNVFEI